MRVFVLCLLLLSTLCADEGAVPPAGDQAFPPCASWTAAEFEKLLTRLRSENYAERELASDELEQAAPADLPALRAAILRESAPEPRSRLLALAREIFIHAVVPKLLKPKKGLGFLGISWTLNPIPPGPPGVLAMRVLEGYAADKAGIKAGDLIIALDGTAFPETLTRDEAAERFLNMAPGDLLRVRVLRSNVDPLEIKIVVGAKPDQFMTPDVLEERQQQEEDLWQHFLNAKLKLPALSTVSTRRERRTALLSASDYLPLQTWPAALEEK